MDTSKPVTMAQSPARASASGPRVETFRIEKTDVLAATHDGDKPIAAFPPGIAPMTEPALRRSFILAAKLRNDRGEVVGYAVETEVVDATSNPRLGIMRMQTQWTLVIPGRGSIFAYELEDAGELGREVFPTVMRGGVWQGQRTFVTTVGPEDNGHGVILDGTDDFAGITGQFVEVTHLSRWSRAEGFDGVIELQLTYRLPAAKDGRTA